MLGFLFKIIKYCTYLSLIILFLFALAALIATNGDPILYIILIGFPVIGLLVVAYKTDPARRKEKAENPDIVVIRENEQSKTSVLVSRVFDSARSSASAAQEKSEARRKHNELKSAYIDSIRARVAHEPLEIVILGGKGWEKKKGEALLLSVTEDCVFVSNPELQEEVVIPMVEFTAVEISGPGKVTGDAGMVGGGFDLEGALKGIALATAVNLLTTHSSTKTIIRLETYDSELIMLSSKIEPEPARILLSTIFMRTRNLARKRDSESIPDQILQLHAMMEKGLITEVEFSKAKNKLID